MLHAVDFRLGSNDLPPLVCNTLITGKHHGVIESPNFPQPYPHNRNCTWTIEAPLGNRVNLTFSHFEVEENSYSSTCSYDFVEVKEVGKINSKKNPDP